MKTALTIALGCSALLFAAPASGHPEAPADIPGAPHGQRYLAPVIAGSQVSCVSSSGAPVVLISNHLLPDVGVATFEGNTPVIHMNPHVLLQMPGALQLFWYGHECAHHLGAEEAQADCWSVRTGRDQGWFTPRDLDVMEVYMRDNPGDWTHMPGPQRVANMRVCFEAP